MKTTIYYYDIDEMSIEYLKGDKFKDRMKLANLEVDLYTGKTALMTSVKFKKDTYARLLLITSKQKEDWLSTGKEKMLAKDTVETLDDFSQLEKILQDTYQLEYDKVRSAESILETGKDTSGVLNSNLNSPGPEVTPKKLKRTQVETPVRQVSEEPIPDNFEPKTESSKPKVQMAKGTERVKAEDYLFQDGYHNKKIIKTRSDQFTLVEIEDYETTGKAVEQIIDVAGYEVSVNKETEELVKYKNRIKELTNLLNEKEKAYLEYQSPESIQELTDSFVDLQDKYEELNRRYDTLIDKGDPNTNKAIKLLQQDLEKSKLNLDSVKEDNEELFKTNNDLIVKNKDLENDIKNLQNEYDRYKKAKSEQLSEYEEKESFEYIQQNIKLSEVNRTLRAEITDKNLEIENLMRDKREQSKGINTSAPDTIGSHHVTPNRRYNNILLIVSLGYLAHKQVYNSILPVSEFTKSKSVLIDLSRSTKLLEAFKMQISHSPSKFLLGEKSLDNSLSTATSLKGTGVSFKTLSTSASGLNRDVFKRTNWDNVLTDLNSKSSILYLGNLEDTSVFDLVRELQQKDVEITTLVVLPAQLDKVSLFNLTGLKASKLTFVGQENQGYSNLKIGLTYRPLTL